ncbi:MAG: hypothetical protein JNK82_31200 [Myxococcaceae bacterium]|nr:hypothetical protein [Myxococcaceae bacterium]
MPRVAARGPVLVPPRPATTPSRAPVAVRADPALQRHTERTWLLGGGAATHVPLRSLELGERSATPPALREVSETELRARVNEQQQARAVELAAGRPRPAARATPEDGSVKVRAFHLAAFRDGGQEYAYALARIGQREGFDVVLRVPSEHLAVRREELALRKLTNVQLQPIAEANLHGPERLDGWSEDQGELHLDGSVSVLPRLPPGAALFRAVLAEREQRLRGAGGPFPSVGAVSERNAERALAAIAVGRDAGLRTATTYLEGGNTLTGTLPSGEGYALVGRDSFTASRLLLEHELGRAVTADELTARVAEDLGVETKHVFAVEQPGDFHLDMKMMLLPGGHVVVNDAAQAAGLQATWLREEHAERGVPVPPELEAALAREAQRAKTVAAAEALAVRDLAGTGLTVHRMAGVFAALPGRGAMNFLNGEAAQNAKGEAFYVALGGDARAEAHVVGELGALPGGARRVHFISRSLSAETLTHHGGLSCRTKLEAM